MVAPNPVAAMSTPARILQSLLQVTQEFLEGGHVFGYSFGIFAVSICRILSATANPTVLERDS